MIIVNNKIITCENNLDLIKNFVERWINKSKEIQKLSLSSDQAYKTIMDFLDEFKLLFPTINKSEREDNKYLLLMEQIANDLRFSLRIAYDKYKKEDINMLLFLLKSSAKSHTSSHPMTKAKVT